MYARYTDRRIFTHVKQDLRRGYSVYSDCVNRIFIFTHGAHSSFPRLKSTLRINLFFFCWIACKHHHESNSLLNTPPDKVLRTIIISIIPSCIICSWKLDRHSGTDGSISFNVGFQINLTLPYVGYLATAALCYSLSNFCF
jgi:hypothetical protein